MNKRNIFPLNFISFPPDKLDVGLRGCTITRLAFLFSQNKMRKWVPVWEDLDGEGGEAFISTGIALGVRVETRIKYRAAYARFIDFLVRNNLAFNAASLGRFLWACRKQGAAGGTLEAYRSAVVWAQRGFGLEVFAADPLLVRAVKGFKYEDRVMRVPRGCITTSMLGQLAEFDRAYSVEYATIFYAVLRLSQFARLRGGDAQVTSTNAMILTLRRDKRMNRGNLREVTTKKEIVHPAAKALLLAASERVEHGQLMFPHFDARRANKFVTAASIACQWPSGLEYDGVHCLRHGGAQVVKAFLALLVARMGDPCAMSGATQKLYTRLNEMRLRAGELSDSEDEEEEG